MGRRRKDREGGETKDVEDNAVNEVMRQRSQSINKSVRICI